VTEAVWRGRTIVLTRPSTGTLGQRLIELGAGVEHVPLLAIGPPSDSGAALHAALHDLATFDWLVVTSANGAASVGEAVAQNAVVRLAAVGAATAAALEQRAGRPVDLVPVEANSDGLLAAFPQEPSRVLLAQASLADDRLAAGLRTAGHDVVAVEAYTTTPVPPSAGQLRILRTADAVVLASGSAVAAWAQAERDTSPAPFATTTAAIVTIGRRTATAAESHGLAVAAIATAPTDDAVVAAAATALAVR
jgi:uroporphyrinogen-III synthase